MKENEQNHGQLLKEELDRNKAHRSHWHHLKRIHHSWIFWVFLVLMLGGILYYIMTVDFAFAPHKQMEQPSENSITQ